MNTDQDIKAIIDSIDPGKWTLSDERQFAENLFVARFNFFLIVFSLFVTAAFANNFQSHKSIVFYAGALLLFLVWMTLYRAYRKYDRILQVIFQNKPEHPLSQIERILTLEGYKPKYRVSRHMGITIPWVCLILLIAGGVATSLCILK